MKAIKQKGLSIEASSAGIATIPKMATILLCMQLGASYTTTELNFPIRDDYGVIESADTSNYQGWQGSPLDYKNIYASAPKESKPLWESIIEISKSIPDEEWDKLPRDSATNLDHYLYGSKKRSK
jgi:hypothetical protein